MRVDRKRIGKREQGGSGHVLLLQGSPDGRRGPQEALGERRTAMDVGKLEETARELVAPGKGILAADESFGTIGKRFEAVGIESSEESRRAYREMLFTTEGIGEFLSGVILFDETI